MHPILLEIPLTFWTVAIVALLFGVGGTIRSRFAPARRDASYLAEFLGLNVRWSEPVRPWGAAIGQGLVSAAAAGAVAWGVRWFAENRLGRDSVPLHSYGMAMALAFVLGIGLSSRWAREDKLPAVPLRDKFGVPLKDRSGAPLTISASELVGDLSFYLLLAGLGGARLLYIITNWSTEYAPDPLKALKLWEGGLVFYGGFIAAVITAFVYIRRHRIPFLPYGDILLPSVALGHAIGRLGCYAAGCCFGNVARDGFPWTVQFPRGSPAFYEHLGHGHINALAAQSLPVYPTQLMEATGEALIFVALLLVRRRKRFDGQVLLTYMFLYPLLRTVLEMFRGDSIRKFLFHWPAEGRELLLSTSQAVSIGVAIAGLLIRAAILRGQKNKAAAESAQAT